MKNQFKGATAVLRNGDPVTELRAGGSRERLLSESTGEFNAYDKKDLARAISQLMSESSSGNVRFNQSLSSEEQEQRKQVLMEAFSSADKWQSLGADIAAQVQEQRTREGFLRKICLGQTIKQGELPRVITQMWDATGIIATGPTNVGYQFIRNKQFFPAEFEIIANLRAERLEIEQVGGDVLDNLFTQGMDSMMVQEDRLWKKAADLSVGVVNPINYISGQLTPQILARIRQGVTDWNLPTTTCLLSNDYWTDIIGSNDFSSFLDPVTKYDLPLDGVLGTLVGLTLLTDGFRQPNQKVLERGEIYVVATPEHHACYSDRGGVRSEPTSGADQGNTTRGWLFSEAMSFTLANPRSVSKAKRIG